MSWRLKGGVINNSSRVSSVTTELLPQSKISKSLSLKSDSVNEAILLGVSGRWEAAATAAAVSAFLFGAIVAGVADEPSVTGVADEPSLSFFSPNARGLASFVKELIMAGVAGEPSLSFFSPNATGLASFVNELHPFAVEVELNPLAGILLPFLRDSFSAMPLESK
jgi:hypothetical protein